MIEDFAAKYRLKVKRAEDGEPVIPGKFGYVYQHDSETLGLLFMPDRPRLWPRARRKLEAAGLIIWQDGDLEGSALFDPANTVQARLALKVVGAKRKRTLTPEQRAAKTAILERVRAARMADSQVS
jgi:hypothetical protein